MAIAPFQLIYWCLRLVMEKLIPFIRHSNHIYLVVSIMLLFSMTAVTTAFDATIHQEYSENSEIITCTSGSMFIASTGRCEWTGLSIESYPCGCPVGHSQCGDSYCFGDNDGDLCDDDQEMSTCDINEQEFSSSDAVCIERVYSNKCLAGECNDDEIFCENIGLCMYNSGDTPCLTSILCPDGEVLCPERGECVPILTECPVCSDGEVLCEETGECFRWPDLWDEYCPNCIAQEPYCSLSGLCTSGECIEPICGGGFSWCVLMQSCISDEVTCSRCISDEKSISCPFNIDESILFTRTIDKSIEMSTRFNSDGSGIFSMMDRHTGVVTFSVDLTYTCYYGSTSSDQFFMNTVLLSTNTVIRYVGSLDSSNTILTLATNGPDICKRVDDVAVSNDVVKFYRYDDDMTFSLGCRQPRDEDTFIFFVVSDFHSCLDLCAASSKDWALVFSDTQCSCSDGTAAQVPGIAIENEECKLCATAMSASNFNLLCGNGNASFTPYSIDTWLVVKIIEFEGAARVGDETEISVVISNRDNIENGETFFHYSDGTIVRASIADGIIGDNNTIILSQKHIFELPGEADVAVFVNDALYWSRTVHISIPVEAPIKLGRFKSVAPINVITVGEEFLFQLEILEGTDVNVSTSNDVLFTVENHRPMVFNISSFFEEAGQYNWTIRLNNLVSSELLSFPLIVVEPIDGLNITISAISPKGDIVFDVVAIGSIVILNISHTVGSNVNFAVSWGDQLRDFGSMADDESSSILLEHIYSNEDTYNVEVSLTNEVSAQITNRLVRVIEPVSGVILSTPEYAIIDDESSFSFTIKSGIPEVITIFVGNDTVTSDLILNEDGIWLFKLTFESAFHFQVRVLVEDALSEASASALVIALNILSSNVSIIPSVEVAQPGTGVLLTVTFTEDDIRDFGLLTYIWSFRYNTFGNNTMGNDTIVVTSITELIHVFDAPGAYSIDVLVTNAVSSTNATLVYDVIAPIEGVRMILSTSTIEISSALSLQVTAIDSFMDKIEKRSLKAIENYKFIVSWGDGLLLSEIEHDSAVASFNRTYYVPGIYAIHVNVTNVHGVLSSSSFISVQMPIASVTMEVLGTRANDSVIVVAGSNLDFMVTAIMDTKGNNTFNEHDTESLNYIWRVNGNISKPIDVTGHARFSFNDPGIYFVNVTASNGVDKRSFMRLVTALEVIEGLTIFTNSSYAAVDTPIEFNSNLEKGTNVKYTWRFHVDSEPFVTVNNSILYSYISDGMHEVTLVATNVVSSPVVTRMNITIERPVTNVIILSPSFAVLNEVTIGFEVTFNDTVIEGTDVTYLWVFNDESDIHATGYTVNHTFANLGLLKCELLVSNHISHHSFSFYITVQARIVVVEISGPSDTLVLSEETYRAITTLNDGSRGLMNELSYMWSFDDNEELHNSTADNIPIQSHTYLQGGAFSIYVLVSNDVSRMNSTFVVLVQAPMFASERDMKDAVTINIIGSELSLLSWRLLVASFIVNLISADTATLSILDVRMPIPSDVMYVAVVPKYDDENRRREEHITGVNITGIGITVLLRLYKQVNTLSTTYSGNKLTSRIEANAEELEQLIGAVVTDIAKPPQGAFGLNATSLNNIVLLDGESVVVAFRSSVAFGLDVSYTWMFGDNTETTTTATEIEHMYTVPSRYNVTVSAINLGMQNPLHFSMIQNVQRLISGFILLQPKVTATNDSTILEVIFQTGREYANITWDFGDGSAMVTGENLHVVMHKYVSSGIYTISASASNFFSVEPVNSTREVRIQNSVSDFSATVDNIVVATGTTLTVIWSLLNGTDPIISTDFGDGTAAVTSANVAPFMSSHEYASPGHFKIIVKAFNDVSAITVHFNITVQHAISKLALIVDSIGVRLGETHTISIINEIVLEENMNDTEIAFGTEPVFVWNFGDGAVIENSKEDNKTQVHKYSSESGPETYTVTVTVSNLVSTEIVHISVSTQIDIVGLSFTTNDVVAIATITDFAAFETSVIEGSHVEYVFNFGDGSEEFVSFTNVNNHVYDKPGTYVVSVFARNDISSTETLTISVLLQDAVTQLRVTSFPNPVQVGNFTTLAATMLRGTDVSFSWDLSDGIIVPASRLPNITHRYMNDGRFVAVVTARNLVSEMKRKHDIFVQEQQCDKPLVVLDTTYISLTRKEKLLVSLSSLTINCQATSLVNYLWFIASDTGAQSQEYELPSSKITSRSLIINAGALQSIPIGKYEVVLRTTMRNSIPEIFTETSFLLDLIPADLRVSINGVRTSESAYPVDSSLVLNAATSIDPDNTNEPWVYQWSCQSFYIEAPNSALSCGLFAFLNGAEISIPKFSMLIDHVYNFSVLVSKGLRSGTASFAASITAGQPPLIELNVLSDSFDPTKVLPNLKLKIQGICITCLPGDPVHFRWSVTVTDLNGTSLPSIDLEDDAITSTGTTKKINERSLLIIREGSLVGARYYIFRLTATLAGTSGFNQITLQTNIGPSFGTCNVEPKEGFSLDTDVPFVMSCSHWQDVDEPLSYHFKYSSNSNDSFTQASAIHLVPKGVPYHTTTYGLGRGLGPNGEAVVWAVVSDRFGARCHGSLESLLATVSEDDEAEVNVLDELAKSGDTDSLLTFASAISDELGITSTDNETIVDEKIDEQIQAATENLVTAVFTAFNATENNVDSLNAFGAAISSITSNTLNDEAQRKTSGFLDKMANSALDSETAVSDTLVQDLTSSLGNVLTSVVVHAPSKAAENITESGQKEQEQAKSVTTSVLSTLGKVGRASLKAAIPGEDAVVVEATGISMLMQRTSPSNMPLGYSVNNDRVSFELPDANIMFGNSSLEFVDANNLAFEDNPIVWVDSAVQGGTGSLEFASPDGLPYIIKDLKVPIIVRIPQDLSSGNAVLQGANVSAESIASHEFEIGGGEVMMMIEIEHIDRSDGQELVLLLRQESLPTKFSFNERIPLDPDAPIDRSQNLNASKTDSSFSIERRSSQYRRDVNDTTDYDDDDDLLEGRHALLQIHRHSGFDSVTWFLGVHNPSNYTAHYVFRIFAVSCLFYDEKSNDWISDGCTISSATAPGRTICECTHLTQFGGGLILPPNKISFFGDAEAFLHLAENPVAISTCGAFWLLYCILWVMFRHSDNKDAKRVGIVAVEDEHMKDRFKYEISVKTGERYGAGTDANVSIIIFGEYGDSGERDLIDPYADPFERGSVDSFLLANEWSLGELQKIRIWHDNSRVGAGWFLSRVSVRDLVSGKRWHFIAERWLADDEDDKSCGVEIDALTEDNFMTIGNRFFQQTQRDFSDRHIWCSILLKPKKNKFTRVQRLTCCMSLLFSSLAVSAAWYNVRNCEDSDDPECVPFIPTKSQLYFTGLVTNLIAFGPNALLVVIFRIIRPKKIAWTDVKVISPLVTKGKSPTSSQVSSFESLPNVPKNAWYDLPTNNPDDLFNVTKPRESLDWRDMISPAANDAIAPPPYTSTVGFGAKPNSGAPVYLSGKWHGGIARRRDASNDVNNDATSISMPSRNFISPKTRRNRDDDSSRRAEKSASFVTAKWGGNDGGRKHDLASDDNSDMGTIVIDSTTAIPLKDVKQGVGDMKMTCIHESGNETDDLAWDAAAIDNFSSVEDGSENEKDIKVDTVPEKSKKPVKGKKFSIRLPWWTLIFCYIFVFGVVLVSSYVTILLGFTFGKPTALSWLKTFWLSFFQSVAITQPFKVFVIALFFALLFKKDERKLEVDDDARAQLKALGIKLPKIKSSSEVRLRDSLMNKRYNERNAKLHRILRELIAYLFYLGLLIVLIFGDRNPISFQLHQTITTELNKGPRPMTDINRKEHFWEFLETSFPDVIFWNHWYNGENVSMSSAGAGFLRNTDSIVVGAARLRQIRVKPWSCDVLAGISASFDHCSDQFSSSVLDDAPFSPASTNKKLVSSTADNNTWMFQPKSLTLGNAAWGRWSRYPGSGFVEVLKSNRSGYLAQINSLKAQSWIDRETRAVIMEFTLYNANVNYYAVVTILFEFSPSGSVTTMPTIWTVRLLRYVSSFDYYRMSNEVLFLLCTIYFFFRETRSILKMRRAYFSIGWNYLELLTLAFSVIAIGFYVLRYNMMKILQAQWTAPGGSDLFLNYHNVGYWENIIMLVNALNLFVCWLKIFRYLKFNRRLFLLINGFTNAAGEIASFFIMFLLIYFSYAILGYLWFGSNLYLWRDFGSSCFTLIGVLLGDFEFHELEIIDPIFAPLFFFSYISLVFMLMLNLFVAVLYNVFSSIAEEKSNEESEMWNFLMDRMRLTFGWKTEAEMAKELADSDEETPEEKIKNNYEQFLLRKATSNTRLALGDHSYMKSSSIETELARDREVVLSKRLNNVTSMISRLQKRTDTIFVENTTEDGTTSTNNSGGFTC